MAILYVFMCIMCCQAVSVFLIYRALFIGFYSDETHNRVTCFNEPELLILTGSEVMEKQGHDP